MWIPGQRRIEGLGKPSRMLTAGFKDAMYGGKKGIGLGVSNIPISDGFIVFHVFWV